MPVMGHSFLILHGILDVPYILSPDPQLGVRHFQNSSGGGGSSHLFTYGTRKPEYELFFIFAVLKVSLLFPFSCFSFHSGTLPVLLGWGR